MGTPGPKKREKLKKKPKKITNHKTHIMGREITKNLLEGQQAYRDKFGSVFSNAGLQGFAKLIKKGDSMTEAIKKIKSKG